MRYVAILMTIVMTFNANVKATELNPEAYFSTQQEELLIEIDPAFFPIIPVIPPLTIGLKQFIFWACVTLFGYQLMTDNINFYTYRVPDRTHLARNLETVQLDNEAIDETITNWFYSQSDVTRINLYLAYQHALTQQGQVARLSAANIGMLGLANIATEVSRHATINQSDIVIPTRIVTQAQLASQIEAVAPGEGWRAFDIFHYFNVHPTFEGMGVNRTGMNYVTLFRFAYTDRTALMNWELQAIYHRNPIDFRGWSVGASMTGQQWFDSAVIDGIAMRSGWLLYNQNLSVWQEYGSENIPFERNAMFTLQGLQTLDMTGVGAMSFPAAINLPLTIPPMGITTPSVTSPMTGVIPSELVYTHGLVVPDAPIEWYGLNDGGINARLEAIYMNTGISIARQGVMAGQLGSLELQLDELAITLPNTITTGVVAGVLGGMALDGEFASIRQELGTMSGTLDGVATGVGTLTGQLEGVNSGVETLTGQVGGVLGWLQSLWGVMDNIWQWLLNAGATIGTAVIGSPSAINFDAFDMSIISTRFPFSVPWDLYFLIDGLSAPPQVPEFRADLSGTVLAPAGDLVISLAPFNSLRLVLRWGVFVGFTLFLILSTRNLVRG